MRLNPRETIVLVAGALIAAVLIVYLLVVEPLSLQTVKKRQTAARLQAELIEIQALASRYRQIATNQIFLQGQVKSRGLDFAPFSYLENLAREAGLTGKIESMSPVASAAEEGKKALAIFDVRLAGIGLQELVKFLYQLESSDKVFFVENLNVKPRYLTPQLLDVSLRLSTPLAS